MAKTGRVTKLDTKTARLQVPKGVRAQVPITDSPGRYLAYQKPKRGPGTWKAYWVPPDGTSKRKMAAVGKADDLAQADGERILTYVQAKKKAEALFKRWETHDPADGDPGRPGLYTVADALRDYFANKEITGRRAKGLLIYRQAAGAWIEPVIGDTPLVALTLKKLTEWRDWMARQPRRGNGQNNSPPKTPDEIRARKSTANRVITILKSALNFAVKRDKHLARETIPYEWTYLERFDNTEKARKGKLTDPDRAKLLAACRPDFRLLVQGALLTACRHGEIRQALCGDYGHTDKGGGYLRVRAEIAKSGKSRTIHLTRAGTQFFDSQTEGRPPGAHIFLRADGTPWPLGSQRKMIHKACADAGIPVICFHELRHVRMSALANAGLEPELNALQAGHATTDIGEKFYVHRDAERISARVEATGGAADWEIVGGCHPQ